MKNSNKAIIKTNFLNKNSDKGITLTALVITIILILILAGLSIGEGTESLGNIELKGFYTQLEIIRQKVDEVATTEEAYTDNDGNEVKIKLSGRELTASQISFLESINSNINASKFKYFTIDDLWQIMELMQIDYNVFINFEDRIVIAEQGITIDGNTYYMVEDDKIYLEQNTLKNVGDLDFNFEISEFVADKYKITITPLNVIGDLPEGGKIKYKKASSKYWEETNNLYFIISELGTYDVIYEDLNKNSVHKKLNTSINSGEVQIQLDTSESEDNNST